MDLRVVFSSANRAQIAAASVSSTPTLRLEKMVEGCLITSIIINWSVTKNAGRTVHLKNEIRPEAFITIKLKKWDAGNKMLATMQAPVCSLLDSKH